MERLKIAVCDDEKIFRDIIEAYVLTAFESLGQEAEVQTYDSGEALIEDLGIVNPDIIFTDIQMEGVDGIQTAKFIRKIDHKAIIIFISGHPELVFDSFEARPYKFLSKPVTQEKMNDICNRILVELIDRRKKNDEYIPIKTRDSISKINVNDIICIESHLTKIHVMLTNGEIWLHDKIDNLEKLLAGKGFLRCHRCYIISKDKINKMLSHSLEMQNGYIIPIARAKQELVRQAFFETMMK